MHALSGSRVNIIRFRPYIGVVVADDGWFRGPTGDQHRPRDPPVQAPPAGPGAVRRVRGGLPTQPLHLQVATGRDFMFSTPTMVKADVLKYTLNFKIFLKQVTTGQFYKYNLELWRILY